MQILQASSKDDTAFEVLVVYIYVGYRRRERFFGPLPVTGFKAQPVQAGLSCALHLLKSPLAALLLRYDAQSTLLILAPSLIIERVYVHTHEHSLARV